MKRKSILVVEDDGLIAFNLVSQLEQAGYDVIGPAWSGEMALSLLETSPVPDLILMDIGLAGAIDGVETARQIRTRFFCPLVFLTAYSSEKAHERMREVSPQAYLAKPFSEIVLLELIRKLLAQHAG